MKIKILISVIFVFLSGCGSSSFISSDGQHRFSSKDKIKKYTKEGKACNQSILFFSNNSIDITIDAARKSKGIEDVVFVEDKTFRIPFLYSNYCIVVKGN